MKIGRFLEPPRRGGRNTEQNIAVSIGLVGWFVGCWLLVIAVDDPTQRPLVGANIDFSDTFLAEKKDVISEELICLLLLC